MRVGLKSVAGSPGYIPTPRVYSSALDVLLVWVCMPDVPASIFRAGWAKAEVPSTAIPAPTIAVVFRKSLLDVVICSPWATLAAPRSLAKLQGNDESSAFFIYTSADSVDFSLFCQSD